LVFGGCFDARAIRAGKLAELELEKSLPVAVSTVSPSTPKLALGGGLSEARRESKLGP